ncbi:hypothetical protein EAG_10336 [Camponotus floridanus]|uniref:Uncharacterized protein n=1 Tax=Camponotus floridanus TaxID=104421 RepID=E2AM28_CAMFO|nr:hypothetical protein EAG_10336 [Camponotus floridanus]
MALVYAEVNSDTSSCALFAAASIDPAGVFISSAVLTISSLMISMSFVSSFAFDSPLEIFRRMSRMAATFASCESSCARSAVKRPIFPAHKERRVQAETRKRNTDRITPDNIDGSDVGLLWSRTMIGTATCEDLLGSLDERRHRRVVASNGDLVEWGPRLGAIDQPITLCQLVVVTSIGECDKSLFYRKNRQINTSLTVCKDDTLCPLLNGCPFVGDPFVGSSRSIQRLIDRRLHTCWPECAQESGEQEKERNAEDRKEAGRGSTWLTNYYGCRRNRLRTPNVRKQRVFLRHGPAIAQQPPTMLASSAHELLSAAAAPEAKRDRPRGARIDQPKISGPSNYPIEHLRVVFWPRPDSFRMPPSWPDACKKVAATGLEGERTSVSRS